MNVPDSAMQQIHRRWTWLRGARWAWWPLLVWAITRLGIVLVVYFATPIVLDPTDPPRPYKYPYNIVLDVLGSRWDSSFYIDIAREGYKNTEVPLPWVAFFPLLPLLMRGGMFLGVAAPVAGILITNTALLLASMLFYWLADRDWGSAVAERAVWYLLIFPTSFFGSAIYTESLFLLGAVAALVCARRQWWAAAAIFGMLTALTRLVGIIVAPMLLAEWWAQHRQRTGNERPPLLALLAPAAVPLGTGAYMVYLEWRFGDALAFVHASAAWDRTPRPVLDLLDPLLVPPPAGWWNAWLTGQVPLDSWLDALFVGAVVVLGLVLLHWRRWSEAVFVLLGVLIPLNSGLLASQRRYMWVLFPAFIVLARWGERRWVDRLLTTLFLLGLGLFTAMFANWYWVA